MSHRGVSERRHGKQKQAVCMASVYATILARADMVVQRGSHYHNMMMPMHIATCVSIMVTYDCRAALLLTATLHHDGLKCNAAHAHATHTR